MTMNLLPSEVKLIELMRALPLEAAREVEDYAAFKASRIDSWTDDRPESIAAEIDRMASDPDILRAMAAIERDFSRNDNARGASKSAHK